jgi:hypothetical protein
MTQEDSDGGGTRPGRRGGPAPGVPRWVKMFGIAAGVLIIVLLAVHLAGGGMSSHGMPAGGR